MWRTCGRGGEEAEAEADASNHSIRIASTVPLAVPLCCHSAACDALQCSRRRNCTAQPAHHTALAFPPSSTVTHNDAEHGELTAVHVYEGSPRDRWALSFPLLVLFFFFSPWSQQSSSRPRCVLVSDASVHGDACRMGACDDATSLSPPLCHCGSLTHRRCSPAHRTDRPSIRPFSIMNSTLGCSPSLPAALDAMLQSLEAQCRMATQLVALAQR